jgi:putative transposase
VAIQGIVEDAPDSEEEYIDFTPDERVPLKCDTEAKLMGYFCSTLQDRLQQSESKGREWELITVEYNNGSLAPELYALKGKRTERALRIWLARYEQSKQDMYALLHGNRYQKRQRKITELEGKVLLAILLHPNRISIGSALKLLKAKAETGVIASPSSSPTLRRWVEEWRDDNLAIWEQARQGSKYVAEHIIKTIHRASDLLSVGEVWVADGHVLAFDIINPKTGKAQRMTMIMVFDWASRYPVGATLAFTEDSQHIQAAFRNGFLNWGALPEYVYLDNGKAFKSKLFHEQWEGHDLAKELGGIFPKLGIKAQFAASYNAKAKVIERFFRTFQEQFERFISSFRGSSVADKPATLMRNEKWIKKLYACEPPTTEEAMQMIGYYIRYVYGITPHRGLDNRKPWEVFNSAAKPENRLVNPSRLNFMMLTAERKAVRNEGIVLNKLQYWHPALVEHMGKPVVVRYDLADARWILVYSAEDVYLCQAALRRAQHPFIYADPDNPKSHKDYKQEYSQIKKLQRQTEQHTKFFVKRNQESVDKLLKSFMTEIPAANNPTFIQPAMIEAPEPGPEEEIARLEQLVVHQEQPLAAQTDHKTEYAEQIPVNTEDQYDPYNDEEFKKMLKTIGIN